MTYKALRSTWVVRRMSGMRMDLILRSFDKLKGPNLPGTCLDGEELANGLRLGTAVLSQDLSGV
jgi:hypothetical protein